MAISRLLIGSLLAAGTALGGATIANAATDTAPTMPASAQSAPAQTEDGSVCKECTDVESLAKLTRADAEKIVLEAHKGGKIVEADLWPWDDETPVWELVVTTAEGRDMWVTVNAIDGKILANDAIECPSAQNVTIPDIPCEK
ncbi:PepSY domain-containing protein [Trueperella pecoris]|uniref:PepSY domain-containing protein n=1 Tax=Trueperella pecoris TaxID=2733571 RepID=A0A7M1QYQ1_9ACTO|nr:PepSY domain-containing protein [Trueperella pecoris]QOR47013.1 PepSY domain-containing protein [Trueperella pecoris]